jgi:hypothetical protein
MYGPFVLELAKIHIEELHAEAISRRRGAPSAWRRAAGRALIGAGARVGRVRVSSVQPRVAHRVERGQA